MCRSVSFQNGGDKVQFVIGDIRDRDKVFEVCRGMDVVIHSAAMKHMPMAEEHPMEAIKTNVLGSQNLIDASVFHEVKKSGGIIHRQSSTPYQCVWRHQAVAGAIVYHLQCAVWREYQLFGGTICQCLWIEGIGDPTFHETESFRRVAYHTSGNDPV